MVNKGFLFKIIITISIIIIKPHNKALDSFALFGHVELEGNPRFTFGFLY